MVFLSPLWDVVISTFQHSTHHDSEANCCPFEYFTWPDHQLFMLVLRDRIFVVQQWYWLQSIVAVHRRIRNRDAGYHGKNLPSLQSIRNVIDHFKTHGTVTDLRKSTALKKEHPIPRGNVDAIRRLYFRTLSED